MDLLLFETEIATDSSTKLFKALVVPFSVCPFSEQRWMPAEESGVYLIFLYHSLSAHWDDGDIVFVPAYLTADSCGRQKHTENYFF